MAVWATVVALANLGRGQPAVVAECQSGDEPGNSLSLRLRELGFLDGEEVQILAAGTAGGPLAVRVGESTFALRVAEAERILVRLRPR